MRALFNLRGCVPRCVLTCLTRAHRTSPVPVLFFTAYLRELPFRFLSGNITLNSLT